MVSDKCVTGSQRRTNASNLEIGNWPFGFRRIFRSESHFRNLLNFYEGSLEKNGLDTTNVNMCVPDGAFVCRKMMNLVFEKDPGHDSTIFNAHDLARASLDGLGVLSFLKSDGNTVLYCELENKTEFKARNPFRSCISVACSLI